MAAFLIILLATLENMWPLLTGYLKTPPGYVFLGTVHHPHDYFYYLSQFAQGSSRWITSVDLFTSEPIAPTFVGWSNVLTGRLFHLIGLSPLVAYHTSVFVFMVLLFIAAYKLSFSILVSRRVATLALYLFALFHAFPILRENKPSYGDYYNNFAVPRVRLGAVPHQLLLNATSMFLMYFLIQWIQNKRFTGKILLGIGVSSFVLASLQPMVWVLIGAATGMVTLVTYGIRGNKIFKDTFLFSLPYVILFISGLPPLLYLNRLFQSLPFSQLRIWEAAQQTPLTLEHFLLATGPVFILSLFAIPLVLRRVSFARLFIVVFPLASITLFLSPIPALLGVSHVRMMSTLVILCLSIIAANGLVTLNEKIGKHTIVGRSQNTILLLLLLVLTIYLLPNHIKTIELASTFEPDNAFQYLPKADYEFLLRTGIESASADTFLVEGPYNTMFPAITGRKIYQGHPLLTIRSDEKTLFTDAFFSGTLDTETMKKFLQDANIRYILARAGNTHLSAFTRIASSPGFVWYLVRE